MNNVNAWQVLGSMALVFGLLGSLGLWALKQIIRAELTTFADRIIEPLKRDVDALRYAVFGTGSGEANQHSRAAAVGAGPRQT